MYILISEQELSDIISVSHAKEQSFAHLILEPACSLLVRPGEVHPAAVALEALLVVVVVLVQALALCNRMLGPFST